MKQAVFVFIAALSVSVVSTAAPGAQFAPQQRSSVPGAATETAVNPVTTRHTITVNGRRLSYTARAGFIPLRDEATGEVHARLFFVSYTVDRKRGGLARPLTFFTAGGPPQPATLDVEAGPRSLNANVPGHLPPPPHRLVDNQNTWLSFTDLVLIDPVGTGYSRATRPEYAAQYYNTDGDTEATAQFIQRYLQRYESGMRQPVFVAGVSYGATRSALMADVAKRHGLRLRGLILLASPLGNEPRRGYQGLPSDRGYMLQLPTMTATAFFHKKLAPNLQGKFDEALEQAEAWATNEYPNILAHADSLTNEQRQAYAAKTARLTGLSPEAILGDQFRKPFRIPPDAFLRELFGEDEWTPSGMMDSRLLKNDKAASGWDKNWNPVLSALYLGGELQFRIEMAYADGFEDTGAFAGWYRDQVAQQDLETISSQAWVRLQRAMRENPSLRVMITNGYYDLRCPYFGTKMAISQLEPDLKRRIRVTYLHTGHFQTPEARPAIADFIHSTLAISGKNDQAPKP